MYRVSRQHAGTENLASPPQALLCYLLSPPTLHQPRPLCPWDRAAKPLQSVPAALPSAFFSAPSSLHIPAPEETQFSQKRRLFPQKLVQWCLLFLPLALTHRARKCQPTSCCSSFNSISQLRLQAKAGVYFTPPFLYFRRDENSSKATGVFQAGMLSHLLISRLSCLPGWAHSPASHPRFITGLQSRRECFLC